METEKSSTLPFTGKSTFVEFQGKVGMLDFIGSLMSIQKLSSFLANQSAVGINLEFEFHVGPKVKHRILLTRDFISFFAKQTVLNSSNSSVQYNDLDLTNLAYQYGNMETDLDHTDPKSPNAWLWVLRATNHQWFYHRLPSAIIARYIYLFRQVYSARPDLKEKIDESLGMDLFDVLEIGTCIFSNFCAKPDGFATSFEMACYTNTTIEEFKNLLTEENINKFLAIFSISQEDFKIENKKYEITDPLLKKYEFNPLKRFPIIKTGSNNELEKYIIPSLPDFLYGCFEGIYYILLDKLEEIDKNLLFQQIGFAFEKFIGELMEHCDLANLSHAELLPEQTYKDGTEVKSADWLLVSDKYIFQIECKKRKLDNYSRAGIENEGGAGISSFLESLAGELDKFPKKETHIREGKVPTVKYSGQEFINIIIYLDEMFAINDHARKEIKLKMKTNMDNFYILGSCEFEILCQHAKTKNLSLKDALEDFIKGDMEIPSVDFLETIYHDFFDNMGEK